MIHEASACLKLCVALKTFGALKDDDASHRCGDLGLQDIARRSVDARDALQLVRMRFLCIDFGLDTCKVVRGIGKSDATRDVIITVLDFSYCALIFLRFELCWIKIVPSRYI